MSVTNNNSDCFDLYINEKNDLLEKIKNLEFAIEKLMNQHKNNLILLKELRIDKLELEKLKMLEVVPAQEKDETIKNLKQCLENSVNERNKLLIENEELNNTIKKLRQSLIHTTENRDLVIENLHLKKENLDFRQKLAESELEKIKLECEYLEISLVITQLSNVTYKQKDKF